MRGAVHTLPRAGPAFWLCRERVFGNSKEGKALFRNFAATCALLAILATDFAARAAVNIEDFQAANGYVVGGLQEQPNLFWSAGVGPSAGKLDVEDFYSNASDYVAKLTASSADGMAGFSGKTNGDWGGPTRGAAGAKLYWQVDIQKGTGTFPVGANIWQVSFSRVGSGGETFFALTGSMTSLAAK